jgi:hypothetical protein
MRFIYALAITVLACSFELSGQSFTNLNGIPGGKITAVIPDPATGKIYVQNESERKLYVSDNNGTSWGSFGPANANIYAFLIDGGTMYYAGYGEFFSSTDGGINWTRKNNTGSAPINTLRLQKGAQGFFVAQGECEGVFVSADAGINWTKISNNIGCVAGSFQTAIAPNGDIYFIDPAIGIIRHTFPTDGIWSNTKVSAVFPKATTGNDYLLSVFVNAAGKVFITHTNGTSQHLIKTSAPGGAAIG